MTIDLTRLGLGTTLAGWSDTPLPTSPLKPVQTLKALRELEKQLGDPKQIKLLSGDLQHLYCRVVDKWRTTRKISRISYKDLKRLPWILFTSYKCNEVVKFTLNTRRAILAEDSELMSQYETWVLDRNRARCGSALLHQYLFWHPIRLPTHSEMCKSISRILEHYSTPDRPNLKLLKQRCDEFGFLSRDNGVSFSTVLYSSAKFPSAVLKDAGLDGGLERCEFLKNSTKFFLRFTVSQFEESGVDLSVLQRVFDLVELDGQLRFGCDSMRNEVAVTLLSPFTSRPAEVHIKKSILEFVLRHFGDPRLSWGRGRWYNIDKNLRRVVSRWIVEDTLETFIALIKRTALDKHWRYRETFWRAFLDKGYISEVWFVLGSTAKDILRSSQRRGELKTGLINAALRGGSNYQSVLLMRVGNVTIAEWSHNGSCRFWKRSNDWSPDWYQGSYTSFSLMRHADFTQRHDGSPDGRWQDQIAQWLRNIEGIEVDREDYFPQYLRIK